MDPEERSYFSTNLPSDIKEQVLHFLDEVKAESVHERVSGTTPSVVQEPEELNTPSPIGPESETRCFHFQDDPMAENNITNYAMSEDDIAAPEASMTHDTRSPMEYENVMQATARPLTNQCVPSTSGKVVVASAKYTPQFDGLWNLNLKEDTAEPNAIDRHEEQVDENVGPRMSEKEDNMAAVTEEAQVVIVSDLANIQVQGVLEGQQGMNIGMIDGQNQAVTANDQSVLQVQELQQVQEGPVNDNAGPTVPEGNNLDGQTQVVITANYQPAVQVLQQTQSEQQEGRNVCPEERNDMLESEGGQLVQDNPNYKLLTLHGQKMDNLQFNPYSDRWEFVISKKVLMEVEAVPLKGWLEFKLIYAEGTKLKRRYLRNLDDFQNEMPPFILSKKDGCAGFLLQDRDGENDEQTHFVMKLHRITETTEMELEFPIVSTSSDVGGKIADNRKWILQVTRKIPNSPDVIEKIPLQVFAVMRPVDRLKKGKKEIVTSGSVRKARAGTTDDRRKLLKSHAMNQLAQSTDDEINELYSNWCKKSRWTLTNEQQL